MKDHEPTVRSRELGEALRAAMERAGMNGSAMARKLGVDGSTVSRMISGKRGCSERNVIRFATACGVPGPELDEMLSLLQEPDRTGWLQRHGANLPKQVMTMVKHENDAIEISEFQTVLVPGLLQTEAYARQVITHNANVPPREIEDRVRARLARQDLLESRKAPHCTYFLHGFVVEAPIGGPSVMSEQVHHLVRMSVRSKMVIRVIPAHVGAHAGLSGPFTLLDVAQFKKVIYLDSETSCLFLEDKVEINAYRRVLASLHEIALDEEQSRVWLTERAADYAEREAFEDVT